MCVCWYRGICTGVKCISKGFLCCCPGCCSGYLCWGRISRNGVAEGASVLECGHALGCMLAIQCCSMALLKEMVLLHVPRAGMWHPALLVHLGLVDSLILSTSRPLFVHPAWLWRRSAHSPHLCVGQQALPASLAADQKR